MRVVIGADHGGYVLKQELAKYLEATGHEVVDAGAHSLEPLDDYPDFAKAVADGVASKDAQRGIMICGSGVGASVAANKIKGVRASVCHDTYSAHQGVEHDDRERPPQSLYLGSHPNIRIWIIWVADPNISKYLGTQIFGVPKYQP